jgi:pyruvate kinase
MTARVLQRIGQVMNTSCSTKIIATLGPATDSLAAISELIDAGVDVFRLNMSHGTRAEHKATFGLVREAGDASGRAVATMLDLSGPKLRVGIMPEGGAELAVGTELKLIGSGPAFVGDPTRLYVAYDELAADIEVGDPILLDDGRMRLEATATDGETVTATVITGGLLTSRKGVNLPGTKISLPSLTAKDQEDIEFGLDLGVDFFALSFVRQAEDLKRLRRRIGSGPEDPGIIAKIEKPEAIENLEAIVRQSNGVMVARGDLGVEISPEAVPLLQKRILACANRHGRISIVATEMLQSMVHSSRPSRAEASDVATAVLDGADCVMLSQETSVGHYPGETVRTMTRICAAAEVTSEYAEGAPIAMLDVGQRNSVQNASARAAINMAHDLDASAVCTLTATGTTARLTSDYRCRVPVLGFTTSEACFRRMAIYRGVTPVQVQISPTVEGMIGRMIDEAVVKGAAAAGDLVVVTTKSRPLDSGGTDTIRVVRVAG